MFRPTSQFAENVEYVCGLGSITPSSSTPAVVSLKNYQGCTVIVCGRGTNTITTGAITLVQATSIAGTTNKTATITTAWRNLDCTTTSLTQWERFDVTNNTFASPTSTGKMWIYAWDVDPAKLDVANGYDCIRAGVGDMGGQTVTVHYMLWPARYAGTTKPNAQAD